MTKYTSRQLTRGLPLVGVFPYMRKDQISFFNQLNELGDTVHFKLGKYRACMINDAEDVGHVLVRNQKNYEKSPLLKNLRYLIGDGLLATDGEDWSKDRRVVNESFGRRYYNKYVEEMSGQISDMCDKWEGLGNEFSLQVEREFTALTFKIISKMLFSSQNENHVRLIGETIEPLLTTMTRRIMTPVNAPLWVPTRKNRTFHRHHRTLIQIADELIQSHVAEPDKYQDLLSVLLRELATNGQHWSIKRIRDHMITLIIAGHESSAMGMVWTFYALAQNPKFQEQARQEAMTVARDHAFTFEDYSRFPLIRRCVDEALRLNPPAWRMHRTALGDDQYTKTSVKKGDLIFILPLLVHRNPRYFENPNDFNPDNFLEHKISSRPKMAYFPFGAGPRVCVGMNIAIMELVFTLVKVLQRFSFELAPDQVIRRKTLITLRPEFGVKMNFKALR